MFGEPQLVMHAVQSNTKAVLIQGETNGGGEGESGKKAGKGN